MYIESDQCDGEYRVCFQYLWLNEQCNYLNALLSPEYMYLLSSYL